MNINYCLPIIKKTKQEVLEMIAAHTNDYQYFEVWIDYLEDLDNAFLEKLQEDLQDRLIVLFRRKNLEPIHLSLEKRFEIITLLVNKRSFIDLDITQKEELHFLDDKGIRLIISYHNYQETPDDISLTAVVEEMKKFHPEIFKLATFCKSEEDASRLLELQQKLKKENLKHIVLGMGKFGTITRVTGTLSGNEMIFAPLSVDESSADGQLTRKELEKIFSEMGR